MPTKIIIFSGHSNSVAWLQASLVRQYAFCAASLAALPAFLPASAQARENGREAGQPDDRPNILSILSDDHTSQTWGIYGSVLAEYAQADNIKRLAFEGMTLDNCFCTNSLSTPSRASILTGRYSHMNGVYTLEDSLGTDIPTLGPGCAISGRESTDSRQTRILRS